jgi:TonB family protein
MSPQHDFTAARTTQWSLAGGLIRQAARSAPPALTARLEEEWLADLAAQSRPLGRLLFALGCCWATCVIAHEHAAAAASVVTSHTGAKTMAVQSHPILPQRSTVFMMVVCLHIGIIYLFASGLASNVIQLLPPTTIGDFTPETRDQPLPPLPPPVPMERLREELPVVPEIDTSFASEIGTTSITTNTCPKTGCGEPVLPVQPQPPVVKVPGGVGKGFPNTDDYYPSSAIRLGQEGVAAVQVCVDEKGHLSSDPALAHTSGIASIDTAALRLAKAGSGHYLPSTENGRPVSSCYAFNVHFRLRN